MRTGTGFGRNRMIRGAIITLVIAGGMALSTGLVEAVSDHVSVATDRGTALTAAASMVGVDGSGGSLTTFTVGEGPQWPAYDPVNHYLYIPESTAHQIQVFSTSNQLVATISTGSTSFPFAAAFDAQNDFIYVTNYTHHGSVYVISGTKIIRTVHGGLNLPVGIAFNPGDGDMAIANWGDNDVVFVTGHTVSYVDHAVGIGPFDVAYDPFYGNLVVTNGGSSNVSCISAVYQDTVGSVPVGPSPAGIAFDPATNFDYVANSGGSNVTIINGACGSYGSITGFTNPYSVAFQASTLEMFVSNIGGKTTVAISTTGAVVHTYKTGTQPDGLAYSDYTDDIYVTVSDHDKGTTVYVIS